MKLGLTVEERELRAEVRAFLAEHAPAAGAVPHALAERMAFLREWQGLCYEHGYVGRSWPVEFGGGGRPPSEQIVIDQELVAAGAPELPNIVGLDVIGPALVSFGDDEQRRAYVSKILSAEEVWCQGFSEPEAGSDLAALRTRAVERGDEYVIDGQKTWVSWGQFARRCAVLVRTDPESRRHRGLSLLMVDMETPGIEVRPMTQITGHAEFSELFFDEVAVPKANLLGEPGRGWSIAMHALGHERGTAALPRQVKLRNWLDRLVADAAATSEAGRSRLADEHRQVELARALVSIEVLRHHAYRTVGQFLNGGAVGPESSTVKLLMAEAEQRLTGTALEVLGAELVAAEPGSEAGARQEFWEETYLYSRAATVYGGSQQIQRGIIADRILQLPQE